MRAREAGVVERIDRAAHDELAHTVTTFLGITIGSTMDAQRFLRVDTLPIPGLGLIASVVAAGLMLGSFT